MINDNFLPESISSEITSPSAIAIDPVSEYIYIGDAGDYVSPGKLYCIDKEGLVKFTKQTGIAPASIAFRYKTTEK